MTRRLLFVFPLLLFFLAGASNADAGGFLKRLFGKKTCCAPTACQPVDSCCTPEPTCCEAQPGVPSDPIVAKPPCFSKELPPQSNCRARYLREERCCDDTFPGEANKDTRAKCKLAAFYRYLYCQGEIEPVKGQINPNVDCNHPDNAFGCGTDWNCYYDAYPCCVYGMNCGS